MIVYGIFDGVGRKDHLVAAAVFSFDDYREIKKGGVEQYLDYLLELEDTLDEIEDPVRILRVPFDWEDYQAWLKESSWQDGPEARSAWALAVAERPEKLAELRRRRPALPAPPEHEREMVTTLFVPVAAVFRDDVDLEPPVRQLEGQLLAALKEETFGAVPRVPHYRKLSRLRAEGAVVLPGSRLVLPEKLERVEEFFASSSPASGGGGWAAVPRPLRIKRDDLLEGAPEYPFMAFLFFPVVIAGASAEVEFLERWMKETEGFRAATADGFKHALVTHGFQEESIHVYELFLEAWEVPSFMDAAAEVFGREDDDDGGDGGDDEGKDQAGAGVLSSGPGERRLKLLN